MNATRHLHHAAAGLIAGCFATAALAGPVIIDGTDSNDHGAVSAGVNQAGWEYMQRALENLGGQVNATVSKTVVTLGTQAGTQARNAIASAFGLSSLVGAGWTIQHIDGAAAITAYFATISTANTGILYLPTSGLTGGDMDAAEQAAVNLAAAAINTFVGGAGNPVLGGGLFAQAEAQTGAWGWLSTLLPGISFFNSTTGTNITLTPAGTAAFPGLTNADLVGADPWHTEFSGNLGGLSVLGVADRANVNRNVILGGGAGTVIQCGLPGQPPCQTPEPESLPLVALALLALGGALIRRRRAA